MNPHEVYQFRKMMDKAGWIEFRSHHTGIIQYENRLTAQRVEQRDLLQMSPHEFSAFVYRSRMEADARRVQEPDWMFTGGTAAEPPPRRNGFLKKPKPQPVKDIAYLRKKVDKWIS